jgi:hypothetical protein
VSRGIKPAASSAEKIRLSATHFCLWPRIGCPGTLSRSTLTAGSKPLHLCWTARLPEIRRLGLPAPAPERDAEGPRSFGSELEPPRSGHRQAGDFGHHGAQPAVPKPLFKAIEDGLVVAALEIDDAVGFQAGLRERGREQIRACDTPKHLAARARGDASSEERGGSTIDRAVTATSDFMQGSAREPAAGEA